MATGALDTQRSMSQASVGSRGSRNSARSVGKYKKVNQSGEVDESLFGNTTQPGVMKSSSKRSLPSAAAEQMLKKPVGKVETDSVVITTIDLDRIRNAASERRRDPDSVREEERKEAERKRALERKKKMIAMDEQRRANQSLHDAEGEKLNMLEEAAQRARDENSDSVKAMNAKANYAKCVTIRDAQIFEKQAIIKNEAEQVHSYDKKIEDERLKAVAALESRELAKAEERMRGAKIIQMQIQQREQERQYQQEQLDMERQAMLQKNEELKREEQRREEERKRLGAALLAEAAEANKQQVQRKHILKQADQEEDSKIAAYIAAKDRKEQERQAELEAEVRRKAEETARLRALQEKHNDRQAELDELRAKRAADEYERAWRAKERAEAAKKQAMLEEIMRSREEMAQHKQQVLSQAAQLEKEQFQRILELQREAESKQAGKERQQRDQLLTHNATLREQIAERVENRARARQEFLDEGAKARWELEQERKRIEAIKQAKIAELRGAGVPDKYLAELQQHKLN